MDAASSAQDALLRAYLRTRWAGVLPSGTAYDVGVGEAPEAHRILGELGARSGAIVTAWNPGRRRLSTAENARRNEALLAQLDGSGRVVLSCTGTGSDADGGGWSEESFLVTDLGVEEVLELGRRWGPNTVLWLEADAPPVLLVTTEGFAGRKVGEKIAVGG